MHVSVVPAACSEQQGAQAYPRRASATTRQGEEQGPSLALGDSPVLSQDSTELCLALLSVVSLHSKQCPHSAMCLQLQSANQLLLGAVKAESG